VQGEANIFRGTMIQKMGIAKTLVILSLELKLVQILKAKSAPDP